MKKSPKTEGFSGRFRGVVKTMAPLSLLVLTAVYASSAINADTSNGIKGITASINEAQIHRSGDEIQFNLIFTNNTSRDEKNVGLSFADSQVKIDGEAGYGIDGNTDFGNVHFLAEEATPVNTWIVNVPKNAETITMMRIVGRAPNSSKSTSSNPYGDYSYKFTNIPIPEFPKSNMPGCIFYDNFIGLNVGKITVSGNDLIIDFSLTNNSRKDFDFDIENGGRGTVRNTDADEFAMSTKFPKTLPTGETEKGQIIITGGAKDSFPTIRQKFRISQGRDNWQPELLLRNISNNIN